MATNKGLGRGLGSLLGIFDNEEENVFINKKGEVVDNNNGVSDKKSEEIGKNVTEIEISLIDNNPDQPRKNFDPTAIRELATSIKEYGVIQPIILKKNGDRYIIVAGERRFRASKLAGLKVIPAIVRDYTENQVKEIALLENIQREDLNPIETARAMKELLTIYGWTQEVLADKLGKSRPVVANYVRLLSLQPEVIKMIESGKLSAGHARSLVVVEDPRVQVKLAEQAVNQKITVRDMEKAVKDISNPKPKKSQKAVMSSEMQEFVNTMQHKFRTKVSVLGNEKKGRIIIDYYNGDDLDRIYDIINRI